MTAFRSLVLVALAAAACGTSDTASPAPVVEPAPLVFSRIAAGDAHSCGLAADGAIYCWGLGAHGVLGSDTLRSALRPVRVAGTPANAVDVVAGGASTCGTTADSLTYCWGAGAHGQLGNGTRGDRSQPARVLGTFPFVRVTLGSEHACGLTSDGRPFCWGGGGHGELGTGFIGDTARPYSRIGWNHLYTAVSAGGHHVCGLVVGGAAWCWGWNLYGQLGNGSSTNLGLPEPVSGGIQFKAISSGAEHTCALTADGQAYCWGHGIAGQLGTGRLQDELRPAPVAGSNRFSALSAGGQHTCALTADGAAYCWGSNYDGQLGNGTASGIEASPVRTAGTLSFVQISAGGRHTCALTSQGGAHCWGFGGVGELGTGTSSSESEPSAVVHP